MALILNLETATTNCSVSLAKDGKTVAIREEDTPKYSHSERLHYYIGEVLEEAALPIAQLDAVAVSSGPGSYTGLRIGISAAKGLCYALDIPLLSVATLESLARQVHLPDGVIIPVLDARRMEVYAAVFDTDYRPLRASYPEIIGPESFMEYIRQGPVYLAGSGAEKCRGILDHPNVRFEPSLTPSSREMSLPSYEKYQSGSFEDLAYYEPLYLKEFTTGRPGGT